MKKILLAVLIIAVVAAIAIGGTVAYFTDSAAVGGNTIASGTVDVTLNADNGGVTSANPIQITKMVPGDTVFKTLRIENTGDVPMYYRFYFTGQGTGGFAQLLQVGASNYADAIDWYPGGIANISVTNACLGWPAGARRSGRV